MALQQHHRARLHCETVHSRLQARVQTPARTVTSAQGSTARYRAAAVRGHCEDLPHTRGRAAAPCNRRPNSQPAAHLALPDGACAGPPSRSHLRQRTTQTRGPTQYFLGQTSKAAIPAPQAIYWPPQLSETAVPYAHPRWRRKRRHCGRGGAHGGAHTSSAGEFTGLFRHRRAVRRVRPRGTSCERLCRGGGSFGVDGRGRPWSLPSGPSFWAHCWRARAAGWVKSG